jgi:hypothetical protein
MPQITVVLPFALPAPEFARELARSLNVPALASLISRTSSYRLVPYAHTARALPHEAWLARAGARAVRPACICRRDDARLRARSR